MRFWKSMVIVAALTPFAVQAQAPQATGQKYALLVGVSQYQGKFLDGKNRSLNGPKNDVTLLYRTLIDSGVPAANIYVLADSLDQANYSQRISSNGIPTRQNILDGLKWISDKTKAGDQALVFMAGHGSFVPEAIKASGRTEDDEKDEIFLPSDIGLWNATDKAVDNQIVDDEVGAQISGIVDRGVFVWFVVDACHSGTSVRSGSTDLVARDVEPADLGIPASAFRSTKGRRSDGSTTVPTTPFLKLPERTQKGGFVAFYAAMPTQRAYEGLMPLNAPIAERNPHGLMTWSLVRALRAGKSATYAGLAQSIVASYWEAGGVDRTPMFDGDLEATPMAFAGTERTWRFDPATPGLALKAGQIDDIGEGAIFSVSNVNAAPADKPLFYARVVKSRLELSTLEVITNDLNRPCRLSEALPENGCKPDDVIKWLGDAKTASLEARLIERVPSFVLQVSASRDVSRTPATKTVIDEVRAADPAKVPAALNWVAADQSADIRLELANNRLWFVPGSSALVTAGPTQAYSLALGELTQEKLGQALRTIARASNLSRLAQSYADTPVAKQLRSSLSIARGKPAADGSCPQHIAASAVPADALQFNPRGIASNGIPRIERCDRVYLSITNKGTKSVDVTPLYLDPWARTTFLRGYRDSAFSGLRLQPNETRVVSWTEIPEAPGTETIVGQSRIILVAVEADLKAPYAADFRHLQGVLPADERRGDGSAPTRFRASLDAAAFGGGQVRSAPEDSGERGGIVAVAIETVAPQPSDTSR
jgi:Caspase domain